LVGAGTIQYKGKNAVMSILTDITENKNVEQFVLNKIIETEENDRKRFAADLHDDLGPILSAIKLRLGLMENTGKPAEMRENIAISNELMGLVIEKVRSLSQTIAPNLLESLGLDSAIRDLCKRVILQTKISLEFKSGIENIRFPQSVELHFYRIISELINNSLKHSDAKIIHINLRCMNDTLKLTYYDDGKGYNLQDSFQKQSGIGLHNILNRVNLINGTIDFQQDKGKTVVKISKKMDPVASN
jgi:signal transduction histidine kinase